MGKMEELLQQVLRAEVGNNDTEIVIRNKKNGEWVAINQYQCVAVAGSLVLKDDKGDVKTASFVSGSLNEITAERLLRGMDYAQYQMAIYAIKRMSKNESVPEELRKMCEITLAVGGVVGDKK